jgi:hypothetical protein
MGPYASTGSGAPVTVRAGMSSCWAEGLRGAGNSDCLLPFRSLYVISGATSKGSDCQNYQLSRELGVPYPQCP